MMLSAIACIRAVMDVLDRCGGESNMVVAQRIVKALEIDDRSPYDRILRLRDAIRGLQRALLQAKRKADQHPKIYAENTLNRHHVRALKRRIKELEKQAKENGHTLHSVPAVEAVAVHHSKR